MRKEAWRDLSGKGHCVIISMEENVLFDTEFLDG